MLLVSRAVRIAVFAHSLKDAGGRSVGINLMRSLAQAGSQHEFLMVIPSGRGYGPVVGAPNSEVVEAPESGRFGRSRWELTGARWLASSWKADWVIALGNVPILFGAGRKAVLLHDPHLFYPMRSLEHLSRRVRMRKRVARGYLRVALPRQDVVFVQTTVAAHRVRQAYQVGSVVVIPNALSALVSAADSPQESDLSLPDARFRFLTLTRYYGRKGLDTLVTMFERHDDELQDVVGLLTIDTEGHPGARRLMERVDAADLGRRIVNLGPVDQRLLGALYAQVDAIVLPTLLESFSGTYVEAMTLGVPIITSDRDFARIVCGDAAVYVEPTDPGAIAAAITDLAGDPERRRNLIAKGKARAAQFGATWDECAAAMLTSLEQRSIDE